MDGDAEEVKGMWSNLRKWLEIFSWGSGWEQGVEEVDVGEQKVAGNFHLRKDVSLPNEQVEEVVGVPPLGEGESSQMRKDE